MSKGRPAFVYPKMAGRFDVGLGFSIARVLLSASTSSTSSRVTPWARMCSSFQSSHSATVGVTLLYITTPECGGQENTNDAHLGTGRPNLEGMASRFRPGWRSSIEAKNQVRRPVEGGLNSSGKAAK